MKLNEYQTKSTLNPKIWNEETLHTRLRDVLMKIGHAFFEHLGVAVPIKDITLTGSNANYNWTKFSDIDLHIIIDYRDIEDASLDVVRELMTAKKNLWNELHPYKYDGMRIELYAQDQNEPHTSTGVYSVSTDTWLRKPDPTVISVDDQLIDAKADPIKCQIDSLSADDPTLKAKILDLKDHIKNMRKTGLEAEGEYSVENLAFKSLRYSGHLEKLNTLQHGLMMSVLRNQLPGAIANLNKPI